MTTAPHAAHSAARALFTSAVCGESRAALEVIAALPPDVWPDHTSGELAAIIRELWQSNQPTDDAAVLRLAMDRGLPLPAIADLTASLTTQTRREVAECVELGEMIVRHRRHLDVLALVDNAPGAALDALRASMDWQSALSTDIEFESFIDAGPSPAPVLTNGPRRRNLNLIIAEPGIGKSWLTLDLGMSLAIGGPVGIRSIAAFQPGSVLYVSYEDPIQVLSERVEKIIGIHRKPEAWAAIKDNRYASLRTRGPLIRQTQPGGPLTTTPFFDTLKRTITRHSYDLVFIDPMSCAISIANENDNAAMGQGAEMLAVLAEQTNAAIVLVHHSSKAGAGEASQHSARGGSALPARARWGLMLTKVEGGDIKCTNIKHNYDGGFDTFLLRRTPHGPFEEIDPGERSASNLVPLLVAAMRANGVTAVTVGNLAKRLGDGAVIVKRIQADAAWATPQDTANAAEMALKLGLLQTESVRINNRKQIVLRVSTTPPEHQYDYDDTDDAPF